ncbi:MAG: UDP-N-acetylmuramoyl-L-alanyl-D-glutamate--2,6-diaminopimelate ligase [Clostridiales bacterium]|nr:UDP-N-acetylmuramoyl-L-alanyl-D-glutamate--2,6-diaminopimelate ligase [Clostridiales bacterium]
MILSELVKASPNIQQVFGDEHIAVASLSANSQQKGEKTLFFCISGLRNDGHMFAEEAVKNGAVALIVERYLPHIACTQVKVKNTRVAMSHIAAAFFGYPHKKMRLVGITGTKGKTTTSYLLKAILEQTGELCGLIGTTGNMIGNKKLKSTLTTPDPIELHEILRQMLDEGVKTVVMEVSAHAMDMHRLEGLVFEAGCYTNLSQDHLDYFGTMEKYFEAKKKFFTTGMVKNVSLNADDDCTDAILKEISAPNITYGICVPADLFARNIEISETGVEFEVKLHDTQTIDIHIMLPGMFNVYNALAAASLAMILGVDSEVIQKGLASVTVVPGRVEVLDTATPFKLMLDYSHSPDALSNILSTARSFTQNRVVVLFGCGGDRDQGKRPIMGEVAGRLADLSILTSDNPRTEDPMEILAAIELGMKKTEGIYEIIENRREAISRAIDIGQPGDIIILAGKGHETYQEIMGVKKPFDEKAIVYELLKEKSLIASEEK